MKLHSLKRKPKDMEESKEEACSPCGGDYKEPEYPWGTRITLDQESLKAMGITELPEAGSPISINGVGRVVSVSSETVEGGELQQRLEFQVTDMALTMAALPMVDRMYPKKK